MLWEKKMNIYDFLISYFNIREGFRKSRRKIYIKRISWFRQKSRCTFSISAFREINWKLPLRIINRTKWVSCVIPRTTLVLSIFRLEFCKRRPAKATPAILHDNRHFEKNRFRRLNFYIVFRYSDTIGLLEFYFALILFFSLPLVRPSDFRLSQSRSLVSLRASPPSRWETINREYPTCWKRTEWKIFPFTVMFRELFPRLAGVRPASQDTFWNIWRAVSLSDPHPPDISKSLLLVLLKFKDAAHNFATSLSRTDRTKFIRHFLRDEGDNEKLRCSVCRIFPPDCSGREF